MTSKKNSDIILPDHGPTTNLGSTNSTPVKAVPQPPPEVDWREHCWPPLDSTPGDRFWAAQFRVEVATFRRMVLRNNLQHFKVGHVIFVNSAYLLEHAKSLIDPDEPPAKQQHRPKKKKPTHDKATSQP